MFLNVVQTGLIMELKELVKKVLRYNKNSNIELIEKAYKFSAKKLEGKKRESGRNWIEHYIEVANLVADLKSDRSKRKATRNVDNFFITQ